MMNCKHRWEPVTSSETLTCTRCGAVTGPKPYEERVKDMLEEPRAWYTVDELNDWADRYEAKLKGKNT